MLFLIAAIFLSTATAHTEADPVYLRQMQSARQSLADNRFDDAIGELLPALHEARKGTSKQAVGAILNDLGFAYRMLGRCQDAIDVLTPALRTWEEIDAPPAWVRVTGLNLMASHLDCGDSRRAATLWNKALAPIAARLDPSDPDLAGLLSAGALVQSVRREYAASESLYSRVIETCERQSREGRENRDALVVAQSGRALARAYLGRMEEAAGDATTALSLLESPSGLSRSMYATMLNNIGLVYLLAQQYDRARPCLERAVALLDESPKFQTAPMILENYALLLRRTGQNESAKVVQERARGLSVRLGFQKSAPTVDAGALGGFGRYRRPDRPQMGR